MTCATEAEKASMVLLRIKYALKELWDKVTEFFVLVGFLILLSLFALFALSPIIMPFIIGYAVFVVVSSPIDTLVKVIIFAAYSFGLFVYGGYLEEYGWKERAKEVRTSLDECKKKVLSVMDVKKCLVGRRPSSRRCIEVGASIESKVYDAVKCIESVKEKL
jgi:hypothetical protein